MYILTETNGIQPLREWSFESVKQAKKFVRSQGELHHWYDVHFTDKSVALACREKSVRVGTHWLKSRYGNDAGDVNQYYLRWEA